MSEGNILLRREGSILRITFNNSKKKNAITFEMYRAMTEGLEFATEDDTIAAVVFDANGDSFTAGNDLKEFLAMPSMKADAPAAHFIQAIANFHKIVLAAVQGHAIGIGTTMLLHCDLIIATEDSKFKLPFIDLNLVPEAASSLLLPLRIGHVKASELLLLGDAFDAETALRLGLVNRVVKKDTLQDELTKLITRIEGKSLASLLETKRLLSTGAEAIKKQINMELEAFEICLGTIEFKTAAQNFLMRQS